jgi:alpha-ribazole phosphatase
VKLLLTRHGQTDWNIAGRYQGQSDIPLNQTGRSQAEGLAKRLSTETIHAVYASDLSRAADTAHKIISMQQHTHSGHLAAALQRDARWRELSFGEWEGMNYKEMSAYSPDVFAKWMLDPQHVSTPNGETLGHLAERVHAAFVELKNKHKDETVLVVSHSGALQALLAFTLGVDLNRYWQFRISQASLTELHVFPDSVTLNLLNDTTHLIDIL